MDKNGEVSKNSAHNIYCKQKGAKLRKTDYSEQKYIRPIGQTRYPLGRDALRNLAEKADAVYRVGKLIFYDCEQIDNYIRKNCKVETHCKED